jgi:hypothetical protein
VDRPNPGYDPSARPAPMFSDDEPSARPAPVYSDDQPVYAEDQPVYADNQPVYADDQQAGTVPAAEGYPATESYPAAESYPPAETDGVVPMTTPGTVRRFDPWNYRDEAVVGDGSDVVGFGVEAIDGHIGKIDKSSALVDESYLVVDTGPWIFGKKVLLPAGTVNNVDTLDQKVYVELTKAQIKDSPEFDPEQFDSVYREKLGGYYDAHYANPGHTRPAGADDVTDQPVRDHSNYGDSRSLD